MYNLFNDNTHPMTGDINLSFLNYVKGNLAKELNRLVGYYRNNVHAVHSNHWLTKIMFNLPISLHENLDMYFYKISDMTEDLSRVLKITSPISNGKVYKGLIYGKGTKEIIVSVIEDISTYRHLPWEELKPIRILSHPRSSIFMNPLKSQDFEQETGVASILIDIPMLMIQYRKWYAAIDVNNNTGSHRSIMQFIAAGPLPNMLYSHMDVAIFNRLASWNAGQAPNPSIPRFPVAIINYTEQLDKVLLMLNDLLPKHKKDFENVLRNIPAISSENYLHVIKIPNMAMNRYIKWAFVISRIPTIRFLVKQAKESDISRNQNIRNEMFRQFRELKNDRAIVQMVDRELYESTMTIINEEIIPNMNYDFHY
jgi:hypothetical protein